MSRAPALLLAVLLASPLGAAEPAPPALVDLTYSGDQHALESLDRDINAAGNDATKLAVIEKRLLETLRRSSATYAARQAVSQRLGAVLGLSSAKGSLEAYKPLPAMLTDDRDSNLARLALEPAPSELIDTLFVSALEKTSGRTRLGIMDSIARRRIASAVAPLGKLLLASDAPTPVAAARALGAIGTLAAFDALQAAPDANAPAIVTAKLAAASRLPAATVLPWLLELQRSAANPVHRTTAFRLSLDLDPATATSRIAEILGGNDWSMKQVALESLSASRAPDLLPTLTGKLSAWDAPTQIAVIALLARRADAAASPAIVTAAAHQNPEIRQAAIEALGFLPGTRETTSLLAKLAANKDSAEGKAARDSLARLNGPEVSASILAGAERGDVTMRAVYLEQLALRNMTEALPLLLKLRIDPDVTIRITALGALGDVAPVSEQKALLDWTIAATDTNEQSRALRSLVNVTLRNPNTVERSRPIFAVLETAPPPLALRLLPALGRMGGRESADAAARLASRPDPKLADAATTALTRWTDATALPALATVAEKAAVPESRTAAVEGALRYFERNRQPWTPDFTANISRVLGTTQDIDTRKKFLAVLHRANDKAALSLVEGLKSEAALKADVEITADVIRANLAGPPKLRASTPTGIANILDGKTSTRWSAPALGEEWVEIDFKRTRPLVRVTLDQTGRTAEFPEQYAVYVTDDPQHPGNPVASGAGQRNKTVIEMPAGTRGRYLIVKNTAERKDAPWAICELYVD